jgi:predicted dehydrogenase
MSTKTTRRAFVASSFAASFAMAADVPKDPSEKPKAPDAPAEPKAGEAGGAGAPKQKEKAPTTTQEVRLRVALVGAGGQGRHVMKNVLAQKQDVVAICDLDEKQLAQGFKEGGEPVKAAKSYTDFRKLLDDAKSFDAVIVATPDHWHAPLCTAFIKAGKHVYCEKPLTNTIADARALRELVRSNPKIVTQMGNQGSAENSLRRSVELIRAGVLGQVREVHAWLGNKGPSKGIDKPTESDPIPAGFNWDAWCGPSGYRPYKKSIYHPFSWRNWYDFGNGGLADFCCHIYNTALRALDLTYATKIEVAGENLGREHYGTTNQLKMHFPARPAKDGDRGQLDPVTLHWYDGGRKPPEELTKDVVEQYKKVPDGGSLIVGERGYIYTNPWNVGAMIKLKDDAKLRDVLTHEPTKDVPQVYARKVNHVREWINACKGEGKTWSDFDFGGHLTEIGLTGVLALRMGKDITWDGERMKADAAGAETIVKREWRRAWL